MKKKNFAIKAKQLLAVRLQEGRFQAQTETNQTLQLAAKDPWYSCFSIKVTPQF